VLCECRLEPVQSNILTGQNCIVWLVWVSFEHSLVQELGYTGYERLRRAFDRAFDQKPPIFDKVVDAGCGTVSVSSVWMGTCGLLICAWVATNRSFYNILFSRAWWENR
jgi:hypothetical protein